MSKKIQDLVAIVLVCFLSILPLIIKILQQYLSIPVPGADLIQFNLVFLFACVAGIITWRDERHLSLATLTGYAPQKVQTVIVTIRAIATTAILTALFFSAFSEFFIFYPDTNVWGIPLQAYFSIMPIMYLSMIVMVLKSKKNTVASIVGIIIGLYISMGPITGVFYYAFGIDSLTALYAITDSWLSFSSLALFPLVILFVLLAILGVPLFIVISGIAYVCFSQGGGYVEVMSLESYAILTDKSIAAIPLFTIAGYILSKGSAGSRLVEVFRALFGWFRGGSVIAAVVVATFFTTFTGVSSVTILALGSLLTVMLTGTGYKEKNAQSLIVVSGAIGLLFPPSVAIIMYGTTNYFSVDVFDLFRAAVIPGAMLAIAMITLGILKDRTTDRPKFSAKALQLAFKQSVFELLMPLIIVAGFFTGFFTLMEAASFAVAYAFCLETFVRKDFNLKSAFSVIAESIPITGGVLIILSAARALSYFLIDANVPYMFSDFIATHVQSKFLFLLLMNLLLLVVGCLMDIYSAIMIVSPLLIPVAESFGISAVQTGVIFLMNLQLGFLTPPVGMDLFIASYAFDKPVMQVVKNVVPFLLVEFCILMLVTYIPWFTNVLF